MSVAFRRESDEEHLEPRFELPIPNGPNLVTARGLRLIDERVAALDAELAAAKDEEARKACLRILRYWQTRQTTAQLAPLPGTEHIAFGSRVRITLNGAARMFDIVGGDEAEPGAGSIAFSAPLARAVMGASVGELIDFGGRAEAIEVLEISAIPTAKS